MTDTLTSVEIQESAKTGENFCEIYDRKNL